MSLLLLGVGGAAAAAAAVTQRSVIGINGASLSAAATYYTSPGGMILAAGTTLANAEIAWPFDCTFKNLYARATAAFSWNGNVTVAIFVNGAAVLSAVMSGGTGTANSGANTASVVAGDLVAFAVTLAAGTGSVFIRNCTVQFETSGQIKTVLGAAYMGAASATTVRWARMGGGAVTTTLFGTPETDMQFRALESATVSKLQGYAITATNGATLIARKNAADVAAMALTFTGNTQRQTDTDSTALSLTGNGGNPDLFTIQRGVVAIACPNTYVMYESGTTKVSVITTGGQLSTLPAGATGYCGLIGGVSANANAGTEANVAGTVPFACTISMLTIFVQANASTADVTATLRKSGADQTAQQITIAAGTTGFFQDATGSVSFAAGDTVDISFTGITTGVLTVIATAALITDIT